MWPFPAFASAAIALIVDRAVGYPDALHRAIGHPVEWMGWLLTKIEALLYTSDVSETEARLRGAATLAVLLAAAVFVTWLLAGALTATSLGWIIEPLIASALIAQRSLRDHVRDVADGLDRSLADGRGAVSRIVGRDPQELDETGVAKAALESLAENTSDGIVAPAIWYAVLGLPGIALYKAANTADSMIGHRSPRYLHFGWAAARFDDLINLPCSRVTGLLFAGAAWIGSPEDARKALAAMWRDAARHASPNAGWPEAALAGALGLRLGGPRSYAGREVNLAWMGDGREQLDRRDIRSGLRLYGQALNLLLAAMVFAAIVS
jgi:adenosylcobinamide-phosphate synthase